MSVSANVCIPNINSAERRKRLTFGIIAFLVGLALLWLLVANNLGLAWRLLLFMPFAGAASGYFQWKDQTCVAFASQSARKIGDTLEPIQDNAELAQVKQQARSIQLKTGLTALLLTALSFLL